MVFHGGDSQDCRRPRLDMFGLFNLKPYRQYFSILKTHARSHTPALVKFVTVDGGGSSETAPLLTAPRNQLGSQGEMVRDEFPTTLHN